MKLIGNSLIALAAAASIGSAFAETVDVHAQHNTDSPWLSIESINCSIDPEREFTPTGKAQLQNVYQDYEKTLNVYGQFLEHKIKFGPTQKVITELERLDTQISELGGNAYQYVAGTDDAKLLDYYAHSRYGISGGQVLKTDSGLVDHFNKQPLTVGDIYYRGCLTTNPVAENPDKILAIQTDGKINGVSLTDVAYLTGDDLHERLMNVARSFKDDYSSHNIAYIDYHNILDENTFININTSEIKEISANAVKELDADPASTDRVKDLMSVFVLFHELQHVTPNDQNEAINALFRSRASASKSYIQRTTKAELKADIFATVRLLQEIQDKDDSPEHISSLLVKTLKTFRNFKHQEHEDLHRYFNGIVIDKTENQFLASKLGLTDEQRDKWRNIVKIIDEKHGDKQPEAIEEIAFSMKYPYQSNIGIDSLVLLLEGTTDSLNGLSAKELSELSINLAETVSSSPEFQKFMEDKHAINVEYSADAVKQIVETFHEPMSVGPALNQRNFFPAH